MSGPAALDRVVVRAADLTGDGIVDFTDYLRFLNLFDAGDLRVDFTKRRRRRLLRLSGVP